MLSIETVHDAWKRARSGSLAFEAILATEMQASPQEMLISLGQLFHFPVAFLTSDTELAPELNILGLVDCRRMSALVVTRDGASVLFFVDPIDEDLQRWADAKRIRADARELVLESELLSILDRLERSAATLPGAMNHANSDAVRSNGVEVISLAVIDETVSPVVRLVNSTLFDALLAGASDIHLEAADSGLVVKYRVDGVIVEAGRVPGAELNEQAISRVKVMAELDITERRTPQDGRFKVRIRDREIDFRVSIMPSVFGEDAVIRILDKEHLSGQLAGLTLDSLGFDSNPMSVIRQLAREPHGMLLITGPTGSGKTTTIYAAISEINDGNSKIITIEDPVEYQLPGVLQIPVNERKGLTFARGLRSILRHDPDKIMVGEIRDAETAQIAVQAALTGHLVFSTVHANNVFDVIGRFQHMDVDPYTFVAALNGIVAQRLVRLICVECLGAGCSACRGTGYKGRRAIGECLLMDDELRELIGSRAPIGHIKEAARKRGTRLLRESAEDMVRSGLTSQQEIDRITFARK